MSIKHRFIFILLVSFFTYQNVKSEVFHWPQICESGELLLKNSGPTPASVWLQKFGKTLIRETEVEVSSRSSLALPLDAISKEERYSLLIIDQSDSIDVKYKCNDRIYSASSLEGGALTFKKTNLAANQIWIQNLFTDTNEVKIEFQNSNHQEITTKVFNLSSLQTTLFVVPDTVKNWSYFKFTAKYKFSVFNLTAYGNEKPLVIAPQTSQVDSSAFYFLVGPRIGSADTFVVKITDEKIAERARELVQNPEDEKMLFARIQKDPKGFNRNWSKTEKSFWSWSTSEVTNFADLGSTACNGAPQEVEDRLDYWVVDPGQICFWNYRVKKELTPLEVASGL